jgi:hypothetical protein
MEASNSFTVHSLLAKDKDGKITGPMSPVLFAKEMAEQNSEKFNRLARVWFNDETTFQEYEYDGLTGHDTLIIACQYENDLRLSLWIDTGVSGVPVAMCCQSDKEIIITPIYERKEFAKKLTKEEIQQLFEYVFNNPQVLAINREEGL